MRSGRDRLCDGLIVAALGCAAIFVGSLIYSYATAGGAPPTSEIVKEVPAQPERTREGLANAI